MNTLFGIPADTLFYVLLSITGLIIVGVALTAWRHPVPFRLALRNIPRRRSQTFLVIGGLALSTMIITSALGIGDTIDYSTKAGVYDNLGEIDIQLGTAREAQSSGFSLGESAPTATTGGDQWYDSTLADQISGLVESSAVDGVVPAIIQTLPVVNQRSELAEAAAELRGLGPASGDGLPTPVGLAALSSGQALINSALAVELDAALDDTLLVIKGIPTPVRIAGIIPDGGLAGTGPAVIVPLADAQELFGRPDQINTIFVSNPGDAEAGAEVSQSVVDLLGPIVGETPVSQVKVDGLQAAETGAEFITTLFITFGTFSIFSGILLIFLIFTVLAAERQSELGMGRAIGQQQADLVRQFITEGLIYDLVAATVGTVLGVLAAYLLAGTILDLLGSGSELDITPRISARSIGIGYTLGVVITFITVSISAVRISRVNIIAAIRNLNIPTPERESQWTLFLHPIRVWRQALVETGQRNYALAIRLFLLAGPRAVYDFWLGLLARGPVLMGMGYLFAWVGVRVAEQAGVYGLGVGLFVIGLGQLGVWLRLPERLSFSLVGLALILYWSLPTRSIGALADLNSNPGDFFIGGLFLVAGAIILFLYNADQLLVLFAGLLGRLGRLLPVARVSIAYPVAAKGRTATTLAMFSLIVFTLVGTATISNTFGNFLDVESGSGGYEIMVQTNPFNPVSAEGFADALEQLVAEGEIEEPTAIAAASVGPVQALSPDMASPAPYLISGVDDDFLATNHLSFSALAQGYESAGEVWAAVQADPTLMVIDNFSVDRTGDPTYQRAEDAFIVTSVEASDPVFEPFAVRVWGANDISRTFTVIGVLSSAPSFYGATMSQAAAEELGFAAPGRYFLRLGEESDARTVANAVERTFGRSGLQTTLLKEQLTESRQSINSIFYLLEGFMGLGLLIGISALGIVTVRSVVERRQQIGVLRSIGFFQEMIQGVFVAENLFVAGLGTLIGYGLALAFSYNLYLQVAADQGLPFLPPWPRLIAIAVTILMAALAAAWLHARRSAKVVIAEALRYQS